ncbi:hypothetical protein EJ06DRAFT_527205 [Trichodelitschia bisporula]|uniref:SHSP domain-containing protein n=1 Tax=Trichodelitschia bisporula TaxID=703511 RepID=A0A6G1I6A6_9PEZI|nr:hypothetical protein EJ06DRAFT_527205 [Trichodelitschia bisporula]
MEFYFAYPPPVPYTTTYLHGPRQHPALSHIPHPHIPGLPHLPHLLPSLPSHNPDLEIHTPRADVRESASAYVLDIELPGVHRREDLELKWLNRRALLLKASVVRPEIPEEAAAAAAAAAPGGAGETSITTPAAPAAEALKGGEAPVEEKKKEEKEEAKAEASVHLTLRERKIGTLERAFDFPVDVDHAGLIAKLQYGVLRIVLPKVGHEAAHGLGQVEVEHTGQ